MRKVAAKSRLRRSHVGPPAAQTVAPFAVMRVSPVLVQCARLFAALPGEATACNVLNFIPTDIGYKGGAWNLQIFHWKAGQTPLELSSDTDIAAAVAAGKGTLEVTPILVRCPVVNFAALR